MDSLRLANCLDYLSNFFLLLSDGCQGFGGGNFDFVRIGADAKK